MELILDKGESNFYVEFPKYLETLLPNSRLADDVLGQIKAYVSVLIVSLTSYLNNNNNNKTFNPK
jgi:hypothetical protein